MDMVVITSIKAMMKFKILAADFTNDKVKTFIMISELEQTIFYKSI